MRLKIFPCLFALAALLIGGTPADAEKVRCSAIRDAAMCTAEPSCWYDAVNNKGCLDGPRPDEDRCAVHGSESTCNTSSFGCTWQPDGEACVTKAN